jgi:hypothetical protein
MKLRRALLVCLLFASQASAQSGLRLPQQGEPGLDPGFARGWLAPDYDRFGFALNSWRETVGFAPGQRMQWSYTLDRGTLAMSWSTGRESEAERQVSLYGRYSLTQDWALSAETLGRDATGLFQLRDFRIGVQRRF